MLTFDYLVIKQVVRKWAASKRVTAVDLGCGIGEFSTFFSKKKYLGIDLDSDSIKLANKLYPGYLFKTGDITTFASKQKFDRVLVVGVLHHLDNKSFSKSLQTIDKSLKKTGRAIIIEAIPPLLKYNFIGKLLRAHDQGKYVRKFNDYQNMLKKKFHIIHAKPYYGGFVDYAVFIISHKKH